MDQEDFEPATHINFALVESVRPPMYKGLKYWGKKPHNIWRQYIENYSLPGEVVLDFFAGSGVASLEAIQAGRRAISLDLNPLSQFTVEFLVTDYDENIFVSEFEKLKTKILFKEEELGVYHTYCVKCHNLSLIICSKWENGKVYEIGYECESCKDRFLKKPDENDIANSKKIDDVEIPYWYPNKKFPSTSSFAPSFLRNLGESYDKLWTPRNLYISAYIFDEIKKIQNSSARMALMFGFVTSLHLTTKMCVPRREAANRSFSTSWGRAAFIAANRQMEMNPLVQFTRSCLDRQGVVSVKRSSQSLLSGKVKLARDPHDFFSNKEKNLLLVTGDALQLTKLIPADSIDFIITDPPYGGLIQYLDLSSIWTVWLENLDPRYEIHAEDEITINNHKDFNHYHLMLKKAFSEAYKVLKKNRYLITTFHNDKIKIWNSLLRAIWLANFKFEKIIYQPNRRTGESNVANPYGTSASDYYLRYKKAEDSLRKSTIDEAEFERVVVGVAKDIIKQRGEPTEKAFLLNGIYVELAKYGHYLEGNDEDINKILNKHLSSTFILKEGTNEMLGSKWWIADDEMRLPQVPLSDRVEIAIIEKLKRDIRVSYDDILANIFQKFPNGLTPDTKNIKAIINEYAEKDGQGLWRLKPTYKLNESVHSKYIGDLAKLGKKLGYDIWIGSVEQGSVYEGKKLSELVTRNLELDGFTGDQLARIKTIDLIWHHEKNIIAIFEIENSTSITSALERASHIKKEITRCIVIPKERSNFFERKLKEPLFKDYYSKGQWTHKFYEDIDLFLKKYGSVDRLDSKTFKDFLK